MDEDNQRFALREFINQWTEDRVDAALAERI